MQIGADDPAEGLFLAGGYFGDCKEQAAVFTFAFGADEARADREFQHEAGEIDPQLERLVLQGKGFVIQNDLIAVDDVGAFLKQLEPANGEFGTLQDEVVRAGDEGEDDLGIGAAIAGFIDHSGNDVPWV